VFRLIYKFLISYSITKQQKINEPVTFAKFLFTIMCVSFLLVVWKAAAQHFFGVQQFHD